MAFVKWLVAKELITLLCSFAADIWALRILRDASLHSLWHGTRYASWWRSPGETGGWAQRRRHPWCSPMGPMSNQNHGPCLTSSLRGFWQHLEPRCFLGDWGDSFWCCWALFHWASAVHWRPSCIQVDRNVGVKVGAGSQKTGVKRIAQLSRKQHSHWGVCGIYGFQVLACNMTSQDCWDFLEEVYAYCR